MYQVLHQNVSIGGYRSTVGLFIYESQRKYLPHLLPLAQFVSGPTLPTLKINSRGSVILQVLTQGVGRLYGAGTDSPFQCEQSRTSVNRMRPKEWGVRSCLTHLANLLLGNTNK